MEVRLMLSQTMAGGKTMRVFRMAPPGERCHECLRRHTRWRIAAKCVFPMAVWISGGKALTTYAYALLAHCRPYRHSGLTVTLWKTLADAEQRKRMIDNCGCGGSCYRDH
jgi:hypothetical protein